MLIKKFEGYGLLHSGQTKKVAFEVEIDKNEFRRYCEYHNVATSEDNSYLRYIEWKFYLSRKKEKSLVEELKDVKALQLNKVM